MTWSLMNWLRSRNRRNNDYERSTASGKLMRCFFVSQDNTFLIEKTKTYENKRKQKKIEDNFRKSKD